MKKIYILTAVLALLTLSLNAQNSQYASKNVQRVDKSKNAFKALDERLCDLNSPTKEAPADAVSVPYYNSLNTSDERGQMGIYDANSDASSSSTQGKWSFFYVDDAQTDIAARYVYHSSNTANDYIFIGVPIILKPGKSYRFSMDVWTGGYTEKYEVVMFDELTTASIAAATQIIPVTTTNSTTSTRIQSDPITVTQESYMYFAVHCVSAADQYYLAIDNLAVEADDADDLSAAISAPEKLAAGGTATVSATVTNNGTDAVQSYTVNIKANGNVISTQTGTSLAAGASATFIAQYATTSANAGTTVNFEVEVVYTDDDPANNTAETTMFVLPTPPPENVQATGGAQSGTMTWDAPTIGLVPGKLIWDFEEASDLAEFTTIDSDGDGYNWSWHYNSGTGNFTVHGGSGVAYSESFHNNDDGETGVALSPDNWMISPEITLGGKLSFWTAHQASYPENFAVYVCQGSYNGDVSNFVKISPDITTTGTMKQYTYDLSQYSGQGYFAFRHYNVSDMFILLIDDIECQTMVPGEQPASYNIYLDGQLVGSVNANDPLSYTFNNVSDGEHTCAVSAVYSYGESAQVPATFTPVPKTATPTLSMVDNGNGTYTITATATSPDTDAEVTLNVTGQQPVTGTGSASITIAQGNTAQNVTATATAQATGKLVSNEASENFTIPALPKTDMPVITTEVVGDNLVITATGNGTVTLNIPGYPEAQGNGSASITVPCGVVSSSVTATATAQEDGKQESDPRVQTITIPAGEGWIEMDGTYNNPGDLLTLEKNGEDIMLVDQFLASTYNNEHSDGYTYTMKETIDNVDWFSNPAPIPVHKTSSTLQGLYTQTQVDNDTLMQYRANVLNTEIDFNVEPDPMVMYYDLYRGAKNAEYPSVVPTTEISRLQQFIDNVNNNIEYFYFETHQSGIAPRYDHVGEQLVERIDTGYVEGVEGNEIAYVPVMWVPGQATARGDGKNNSYGSDIKHNWLGGVTIDWIRGTVSTNSVNGVDYGKWTAPNGVEYCVYTPWIKVSGIQPADWTGHDHDQYTFTPYMYRVWCIYPDARDFTHNADGQLTDANVELPDTMLLQTVYVDDPTVTSIYFGKEQWVPADGHLPYAIGVPTSVADNPSVLQFVVRFYYKRNVVEGSQPSGLRDGGEEYYIAEGDGDGEEITTGIVEFYSGKAIVDVTYVNAQGMKSDKPFSGVNIVITRYSDGTTSTTKVVR
jgi:hypothetical protein